MSNTHKYRVFRLKRNSIEGRKWYVNHQWLYEYIQIALDVTIKSVSIPVRVYQCSYVHSNTGNNIVHSYLF